MKKAIQQSANRIARQAGDIAMSAPVVVAQRLTRIAQSGASPTARDLQEMHRMTAEKVSAFGEAWTAMTWRLAQANWSFAQTMLRTWWAPARGAWLPFGPAQHGLPGRLPTLPLASTRALKAGADHLHHTAMQVAGKGMAPVRRRVVANAKRLSKAKSMR